MFCPNCFTRLQDPGARACANCGALFGKGSSWNPVAAPLRGNGKEKPLGFARSGLALLFIFVCVCFLSLSLALRGTAVGSTPPLVLALVFGASGFIVVIAKSSKARRAAAAAGVIIFAVLAWVIGSVLVGLTQ